MKKLSFVASLLLVTSTSIFAESDSIKEAIENGMVSGDVTIFYKNDDGKDEDEGFANASLGLAYQTDSVHGINAKVAFRANQEIYEKEDENYDDEFENDSLLTEAFFQYRDIGTRITLGRQAIDLEWLGDYNEAITVQTNRLIDNTTITLGYVDRQAESEEDESTDFEEINDDGMYVLDVNYEIEEDESGINAYYYSAPDYVDFYGIKAKAEIGMIEATAHYAQSDVDASTGEEDGDILNVELELETSNYEFAVGYIKTDKDGGIGLMGEYGDNIDPTEELDDSIYAADSETYYAKVEYAYNDLEVGVVYAQAEHGENDDKDKEITLEVEYAFTDSLSTEFVYSNTNMEDSDDDRDVVSLAVQYSF